jgi:YidC/Oxa1 family membrane protein insertase
MKFLSLKNCLALLACILSQAAWAETVVQTEQLLLSFDERGQLLSAQACFPDCTAGTAARLDLVHDLGLASFENHPEGEWQSSEEQLSGAKQLDFKGPDEMTLRWTIPDSGYALGLEAMGLGALTLQAGEGFRAREAPGFGEWLEQVRYLAVDPGNIRQVSLDDSETAELSAEWVGFRSRFWAVLLTADSPVPFQVQTAEGNLDPILVSQATPETMNWHFYLGPVERESLSAADELLADVMYAGLWFWLRWICIFLAMLLGWIQSVVLAWGPSIMLLSVCVGVLMLPLSRLADQVQQQVHQTEARLAPELARIKREFKGEEQAAKIIAYYKTERVHPLYSLKSLLGVAIVIPVFIGAFDMLAENIHLMNTSFLWIADLSRPDHLFSLPVELPFFGSGFNLLPFLMTGLSVWASLLHKPLALQADLRKSQVRNMILLAAAFFVLFYTFPAGMVLYWATNNLISVVKNLWNNMATRRAQAGL